jgi:hypothetical protein
MKVAGRRTLETIHLNVKRPLQSEVLKSAIGGDSRRRRRVARGAAGFWYYGITELRTFVNRRRVRFLLGPRDRNGGANRTYATNEVVLWIALDHPEAQADAMDGIDRHQPPVTPPPWRRYCLLASRHVGRTLVHHLREALRSRDV